MCCLHLVFYFEMLENDLLSVFNLSIFFMPLQNYLFNHIPNGSGRIKPNLLELKNGLFHKVPSKSIKNIYCHELNLNKAFLSFGMDAHNCEGLVSLHDFSVSLPIQQKSPKLGSSESVSCSKMSLQGSSKHLHGSYESLQFAKVTLYGSRKILYGSQCVSTAKKELRR